MLRVTADANIYISALNFGGLPDRVLDLARAGSIRLAISDAIVNEVTRVLRHKFGWADDAIALAKEQIAGFTERVEPEGQIDRIVEDPTDNRILECASAGAAEFLVTGDRHLLKLGLHEATRIVSPAEFLAEVGVKTPGNRE